MLIFNSDKPEYKELHQSTVRYFFFLYEKAKQHLTPGELKAWFIFSEVPNNWLGFSISGNKGLALGSEYAEFLYRNIGFAIETNNISQSEHLEKAMLLYRGSGKDRISDLTVNLIKGFLCSYTEVFAKKHLDGKLCMEFCVDRAYFNYDTESFVSADYYLPFVLNDRGIPEYVLLTPKDILRVDEPSINRKHMLNNHEKVRRSIGNDELRAVVNNYIGKAVREYIEKQRKARKPPSESTIRKIEKKAFEELLDMYPILYDYYVALRENDSEEIKSISEGEYRTQFKRFIEASKTLIAKFSESGYTYQESLSAAEEAKRRLLFLKHEIEDCDGYKTLYANGEKIAQEGDLQRLFRLVWFGTSYKLDAEVNNGRGQADFLISKGQENQRIIEFKLASNTQLARVFSQVKIYEEANCADGSLIAIFFFTAEEEKRALNVIKSVGYEFMVGESIILIDCRADNKPSASIA